jgi:hypothetical protein
VTLAIFKNIPSLRGGRFFPAKQSLLQFSLEISVRLLRRQTPAARNDGALFFE